MLGCDREGKWKQTPATLKWQRTRFNKLWHKSEGGHSSSNISSMCTDDHSNTINTITSSTATTDTTTAIAPNTSATTITGRWITNLSSIPLAKVQESLFTHRPNFSDVPLYLSNGEYITIVEACYKLIPKVAELRSVGFSNVLVPQT